MLKWFLYGFIIFIIILTSGCSNEDSTKVSQETDTDTNLVLETTVDVIKVGFVEYPPYEYVENEEIKGIGIDMMREAFKRVGYSEDTYEFVQYPWARLMEMTKIGSIHIILDASPTDERKVFLDFF